MERLFTVNRIVMNWRIAFFFVLIAFIVTNCGQSKRQAIQIGSETQFVRRHQDQDMTEVDGV